MTKVVRGRSIKRSLSLPVHVRTPDVELFDLGRTVDRAALAKGVHRLIIGRVHGGCCASLMRAVIRNGAVRGIEIERCKESIPVNARMRSHLRTVLRTRAKRRRARPFVPVEQFLRPAAMRRMATSLVEEECVYICIPTMDGRHERCYLCCITTWPSGSESRWCLGGDLTPRKQ